MVNSLVSRLPDLPFALTSCFPAFLINFAGRARVVKWQTRTFEGRMPKGMRVQVPPRALSIRPDFRPPPIVNLYRDWLVCRLFHR